MRNKKFRNILISLFVLLWLAVFNYESVRHFYLQPHFDRPLPKTKFLFPPAGWIMFFKVDDQFGTAEVYGLREEGEPYRFDPHEILETRFIGFDNIYRGVLGAANDSPRAFCRFMKRKFPGFDDFLVTVAVYPSLTQNRYTVRRYPSYQCSRLNARKGGGSP